MYVYIYIYIYIYIYMYKHTHTNTYIYPMLGNLQAYCNVGSFIPFFLRYFGTMQQSGNRVTLTHLSRDGNTWRDYRSRRQATSLQRTVLYLQAFKLREKLNYFFKGEKAKKWNTVVRTELLTSAPLPRALSRPP
jgi:hypothetical protein